MSAQVTVMVQSEEFVRVRLVGKKVNVEATLAAPHNYAEHWQAQVLLEIRPSCDGVGPRYKTIEHVASDPQREVVATWLVQTLSRLVGRNTLL